MEQNWQRCNELILHLVLMVISYHQSLCVMLSLINSLSCQSSYSEDSRGNLLEYSQTLVKGNYLNVTNITKLWNCPKQLLSAAENHQIRKNWAQLFPFYLKCSVQLLELQKWYKIWFESLCACFRESPSTSSCQSKANFWRIKSEKCLWRRQSGGRCTL